MDETSSKGEEELESNAESFAINTFKSLLASREWQARNLVDKVARIALSAVNASALVPTNEQSQVLYVSDMPKHIADGLRNGILKLDKNKAGEMFAQLRGLMANLVKKFPSRKSWLSKELIRLLPRTLCSCKQ